MDKKIDIMTYMKNTSRRANWVEYPPDADDNEEEEFDTYFGLMRVVSDIFFSFILITGYQFIPIINFY